MTIERNFILISSTWFEKVNKPVSYFYLAGRIFLYIIFLACTTVGLALAANELLGANTGAQAVAARAAARLNIFNVLLFSPFIETFFMYFLWIIIGSINSSMKNGIKINLYILTITLVAWLTHGDDLLAIFPSIMFLTVSIYFIRSIFLYRMSNMLSLFGVYLIHTIYNIPSVIVGFSY